MYTIAYRNQVRALKGMLYLSNCPSFFFQYLICTGPVKRQH